MAKKRLVRKKRIAKPAPETPQTEGLESPACGCRHLPVLYTRRHPKRVKRVRECRHCGRRIVSYERIPEDTEAPWER